MSDTLMTWTTWQISSTTSTSGQLCTQLFPRQRGISIRTNAEDELPLRVTQQPRRQQQHQFHQ
eukprot:5585076-Amphidinium_carterae.1